MNNETTIIRLSDGTSVAIIGNVVRGKQQLNGMLINTISFMTKGLTEAGAKEIFTNHAGLLSIIEFGKDNVTPLATYYNYNKLFLLSQFYEYGFIDGFPVISITLGEETNLSETISKLTDKVLRLSSENATIRDSIENSDVVYKVNIDNLFGDDLKDAVIKMSKDKLTEYLKTATLTTNLHETTTGEGAKYSINEDSQLRLQRVINLTKSAVSSNNTEFKPYWHRSGDITTYDWTLAELERLALEIDIMVQKLISKQQDFEIAVRAETDDSLIRTMFNNLTYDTE